MDDSENADNHVVLLHPSTMTRLSLIRDGKVAEPVRDVILAGNLFETLQNVTAVGNDFEWERAGRCGKDGQSMPVAMGSPHLRIENVVIGGK